MENEIIEKDIRKLHEYRYFIDNCRTTIEEIGWQLNEDILKGKWMLGQELAENIEKFELGGYGTNLIPTIAHDLATSVSTIYNCLKFYKKYPLANFDEVIRILPGGKSVTWYKLCQEILPAINKEQTKSEQEKVEEICAHEEFRCLRCKKKFNISELIK